jgi:hypothetical protein
VVARPESAVPRAMQLDTWESCAAVGLTRWCSGGAGAPRADTTQPGVCFVMPILAPRRYAARSSTRCGLGRSTAGDHGLVLEGTFVALPSGRYAGAAGRQISSRRQPMGRR